MSLVGVIRFGLLMMALSLVACQEEQEISFIHPVNWEGRTVANLSSDSLEMGTTYLSVYSQIYSDTEHRTHDLTATISMRNTSVKDTIYVSRAAYFDTHGELIRTYFDKPIFLSPMETVEIVIDERDKEGGTGANFIFDWQKDATAHEPLFEAVMISTSGSQGLSFSTQGKRVE